MLPSQRLTLELPVLNGAPLLAVAQRAVPHPVTWSSPEALHFTFLFIGRPAEILPAVREARTDMGTEALPADRFMEGLREWLHRQRVLLRRSVPAVARDLGTLGPGPRFAVVIFLSDLPPEVTALHEAVLADFVTLLEQRFEVPDGREFTRTTQALGFTGKSWRPHVTLGRSSQRIALPSEPQRLTLGPLRVRNGPSIGLAVDGQ